MDQAAFSEKYDGPQFQVWWVDREVMGTLTFFVPPVCPVVDVLTRPTNDILWYTPTDQEWREGGRPVDLGETPLSRPKPTSVVPSGSTLSQSVDLTVEATTHVEVVEVATTRQERHGLFDRELSIENL
ncbi:hypothetical protein TanjilG_13678 [Lupinus angustifolius]|uniref:Uncharacterized protein n=1 Tax=Lupinus angustifolius TaxID=3871 RepID=A0A1J7GWI5_LUPAN|nr:hypothetical protein TanjilG_13678 [Lupinus angustifolius]